MKAQLKGKISSMREDVLVGDLTHSVRVRVNFEGRFTDVPSKDAREVKVNSAVIVVRPLVAEKLHYGQTIYLTLSTDAPPDGELPA